MPKRKKRLQKGIESLQEQITLHEQKLRLAQEEGLEELADYYGLEIAAKKKTLRERQEILDNQ